MNRFPLWKYILILFLIALAFLYALPNLYGESPAVQISPKGGQAISQEVVPQIQQLLAKSHLPYRDLTVSPYTVELRFSDTDLQMQAQEILQTGLGQSYTVAINLAPNTPKWLLALGAYPMKLGLDLRGGMYFLLDVDMQTVLDNNLDNYAAQLRADLRAQDLRYGDISVENHRSIQVLFRSGETLSAAKSYISSHYPELAINRQTDTILDLILTPAAIQSAKEYAVSQVVQVMRNRVNELGVAEASVAKQGSDRVVIELPGVQDAARAKEILGGTATLKLMLVDESADVASALAGNVPIGDGLYYTASGEPHVLKNRVILTGNAVVGASAGFDPQTNLPIVSVRLSGPEVSYFSQVTRDNVGHQMAIVLVQSTFENKMVEGKEVTTTHTQQQIINVATIHSQLGNNFQIEGIGNMRAAQNLALMIRAGALPAPVQIAEEKQIGPTLGAQNIKMGTLSVVVAMIVVMLFMVIYYRLFGFIANLGLLLNLVFIVAVMSILPGATLSLPGIAGIVLNVGMAIDANVLIFERIREELRNKTPIQAAIHTGYERAFATIVDSNVTTLIVAVILFAIGTGAVQGFAVTLMIGIITSMFTAITVTRGIVNLIYGQRRQVKKLSIGIAH